MLIMVGSMSLTIQLIGRLIVITSISGIGASGCWARPAVQPGGVGAALAGLDTVILAPSWQESRLWLLTGTRPSEKGNSLKLSLIEGNHHRRVLWTHVFNDGYAPFVYPSWHWGYGGQPALVFTYQLGAAWSKLTVIGLGRHGPVILQQIDAAAWDVISVTSDDGNGDLHAMDHDAGSFRCFDWTPATSTFTQRECRTLGR